jgi:hypothetical protein
VVCLYNGLSDHDAQLLRIKDVNPQILNHYTYITRIINKYSIDYFKIRLSYETWDNIFTNSDNMNVNLLFSMFLNNYLRIFYTSFPLKKVTGKINKNHWIIPGIRISCNHKKYLSSQQG